MQSDKPRVVVLGSGFGAFSFVKHLNHRHYDVTVVSPRNHFLFTPLLPSTTVGTVEFRSIIEPVRLADKRLQYYQAQAASVDLEGRVLRCEGAFQGRPFDVAYDELLIAVGAVSHTFGVPGVEENAHFLKELSDARSIRQKIIECFERAAQPGRDAVEIANLLRFVVVGGGPTGVEFAAELHDFVTRELRRWFPKLYRIASIVLVEAQNEILTSFDRKLSAYAKEHFLHSGIEVRTQTTVKAVHPECVELQQGEMLHCGLVVWSTGIAPTAFVRNLPLPKDKRGRLLTDDHFRVIGVDHVYALGDCARPESAELAATAQAAQQGGKYLARAFNQRARKHAAGPFEYKHMGMLAYIGGRRALADLRGYKGHGYATWVFWRSAYLTRLVSVKNKVLVFFNWLSTFIFGRDISRF